MNADRLKWWIYSKRGGFLSSINLILFFSSSKSTTYY